MENIDSENEGMIPVQ